MNKMYAVIAVLAVVALYFGYENMSNKEAIEKSKAAKKKAKDDNKEQTVSFVVKP